MIRCICLILALGIPPIFASELKSEKLDPWTGESLAPDQGAFLVQSTLIDTTAQTRLVPISFWLSHLQEQRVYRIDLSGQNQDTTQVWPLKAGSYELVRVRYLSADGRDWSWRPNQSQLFHVEAGSLSQFGSWFLVQVKKGQKLNLLIKSARSQVPPKLPSSLNRLIDGETKQEILLLGQKSEPLPAPTPEAIGHELGLKVDLFRQSSQEPLMTQVIQARTPELLQCYQEYQTRNPQVSGVLAFTFIYSGSDHVIKSLKIKQAELRDQRFLSCVIQTIKNLNFPMEKSLIGEMSFSFQRKGT